MRRLLALVPAALLTLSLIPAAHAAVPASDFDACKGSDNPTGGLTASVKWEASGKVNYHHTPILLLQKLTVSNTCTTEFGLVRLKLLERDANGQITQTLMSFGIAPSTTRTLGQAALTKLGVGHFAFTSWYPKINGLAKDGVCLYYNADFLVEVNGTVSDPNCH